MGLEPWRSKGDIAVTLFSVRVREVTEVGTATATEPSAEREKWQRPWEGLEGVEMRALDPSAVGEPV